MTEDDRFSTHELSLEDIFKHFDIPYPPPSNHHVGTANPHKCTIGYMLEWALKLYGQSGKVHIILHYDPDFPRMAYEVIEFGADQY